MFFCGAISAFYINTHFSSVVELINSFNLTIIEYVIYLFLYYFFKSIQLFIIQI